MTDLPWSEDKIESLRKHQAGETRFPLHPITCNGGRNPNDHVHDHEVKLVPTRNGWVCPECGTDEGNWTVE